MGRGDDPEDDPWGALAAARPEARSRLSREVGLRRVLGRVLDDPRPLPRLGRWVVERKIGEGGMGSVFRAHDPDTSAPVAIKVLAGGGQRARFAREAALLRAIDHPRVVRYLDDGETDDGTPFLVMAWLDGIDLGVRLRAGPLGVDAALRLVRAAAEGLAAAHRVGVVHRDVKPSNLLLVADDDVRLVDFGVARGDPGEASLTVTGEVLGTPAYMAPEQLRGEHDLRTDVYALGATLFEALTGRPPFVAEHPGAMLIAVLHEPAPRVSELRPDVPAAVDALVARMLAKDVEDRPRDMDAVIVEVSGCLAEAGAPARRAAVSRGEQTLPAADAPAARIDGPVGRARPLGLLLGALQACAEDRRTLLARVTGAAGTGRTLVLDALAERHPGARWLRACGSRERAGVPFAGLRDLAGVAPWSLEVRAILDEVGRADADPSVVADRLRLAWIDALDALLDEGPVVVALDDADRLDLASLRLVDAVLRASPDRPLAVVTASHVGSAPAALGGELDPEQRVDVVLGPLAPAAIARLVASLAPAAAADDRAHAVRLAEGHPGQAAALATALAAGVSGWGSVTHAAWARLQALDGESRRVLRAASLVGDVAWLGALARLLDVPSDSRDLRSRVGTLVAQGLLRWASSSRIPGEDELGFVSEGVRLAAYHALPEDDRRRGHAVVARWLGEVGAREDAALARHLVAAGEGARAAEVYLALARAALVGEDAERARQWLDAASTAAGDEAVAGQVAAARAAASFWAGQLDDALARVEDAQGRLAPGSAGWLDAANLAITVAGQRGDHARVERVAVAVQAHEPQEPRAAAARVVGLCRAVTQLVSAGRPATELVAWVRAVEVTGLGPEARAWVWRARGTLTARAFDETVAAFVEAHRAHLEAGDRRSAAQIGLYLGSIHTWAGAWERAAEATDDALRDAVRLGAEYLVVWGRYTQAKRLAETAALDDAFAAFDEVVARSASSPRIRAGAWLWSALAALRADRPDEALVRAAQAAEAAPGPLVQVPAWAVGELARVALGQDPAAEAPPVAAWDPAQVEFGELPPLAVATRALSEGRVDDARRALAPALAAIDARAATLADPLRRNRYLEGPWVVATTLRLAARLAPDPPLTAPGR